MPEPGMGANNDHASSASAASSGMGSNDSGSDSHDRAGDTTADSIAASPTTGDSIASQPSASDTLSDSDPANAATADGPAGGSPEAWDGMMADQQASTTASSTSTTAANDPDHSATQPADSSITIDPSTRTANTADGPMGGSPTAFDALAAAGAAHAGTLPNHGYDEVGIDVPATKPQSPPPVESNSAIAGTLPQHGIPAIPKPPSLTSFFTENAVGRFFSRLLGVNPVTVAVAAMTPTALGGNRQTYPIENARGLDVEFSFHPSELRSTVTVNGNPTDIEVEPVYSSTGEIESFRPVSSNDSDRLEELTGVTIMSSEESETDEATATGNVQRVDEQFVDDGDGLPVRDASGKVHGVLPSPEQLDDYSTEELEDFKEELEGSVEERIRKNEELGAHKPHGERQAAEQDLLGSIDKIIGNRGN